MTRPDHSRNPLFALGRIGGGRCEWSKAPALGEAQCRGDGFPVRLRAGGIPVRHLDTGKAQLLG